MTRDEATKLQVGVSKIFIADTGLEEVYETTVTGVTLELASNSKSPVKVHGWCKKMHGRVYESSEVHGTEIDALRKLSDMYTLRSDQNLGKRHAVCEKIAKLKKKGGDCD